MKKLKSMLGFTLIEIMVVVSIIALLSSVVLSALSGARSKSNNSAVKQDLLNVRSEIQIIFSETGSYATGCTDPVYHKTPSILAGAGTAGSGNPNDGLCNSSATQWAAGAPLKTPEGTFTYWCIDNTLGTGKGETAPLGGLYACQQ